MDMKVLVGMFLLAAAVPAFSTEVSKPELSLCSVVKCKTGCKCVVKVNPCLVPPCPMSAKCECSKPGVCPTFTNRICTKIFRPDRCQEDEDCSGRSKCCRARCGNKACLKPVAENCSQLKCRWGFQCVQDDVVCKKSPCPQNPRCVRRRRGVCPATDPDIFCTAIVRPDLCKKDSDCSGRSKCCFSDCRQRICRPPNTRRACNKPKKVGPCEAAISRYFYNAKTQLCEKFTFGGCKGNKNNFRDLKECLDKCGVHAKIDLSVCRQPKETGRCRAYMPRYYYDSETNKCRRFIYGGCGGNKNNFQTLPECLKRCPKRKG